MIWKDVIGFEGAYKVSDKGDILSLARLVPRVDKNGISYPIQTKNRMLSQATSPDGYKHVHFYLSSSDKKTERVHRIVARAFIPNPLSLKTVNHKDGDKANNRVENLEWCTHQDNMAHSLTLRSHFDKSGENHRSAKLTWDIVNWIRTVYTPANVKQNQPFSYNWLADRLGVTPGTVIAVVLYYSWIPDWMRLEGFRPAARKRRASVIDE